MKMLVCAGALLMLGCSSVTPPAPAPSVAQTAPAVKPAPAVPVPFAQSTPTPKGPSLSCMPPGMPAFSTLRPVGWVYVHLDTEHGSRRAVGMRYNTDQRPVVLVWHPDPRPGGIVVIVDDDPDGPNMAWYDDGAMRDTPTRLILRETPTQACQWKRVTPAPDSSPESQGQSRGQETALPSNDVWLMLIDTSFYTWE